jgi:hypothetical protein
MGTPAYAGVTHIWQNIHCVDIEMLPGLIGSFIAIANMSVLHLKLKEPMPEIKKEKMEIPYALSLFQFVTNISEVIGASTLAIFRSSIEGYNERFNRNIKIDDTIRLSNINDGEWPKLLDFVLNIYYMCIGPVTWEEARQIEGLDKIAEGAEERYGKR